MKSAELLDRYAREERCFSGADLRDADLRRADLRGAYLRRADLRCADLTEADLRCSDLRYADLSGAYLRYADLRGADLTEADLRGADLDRADLRCANLREANLTGANFDYSSFPLWCGSFDIICDARLVSQLLYHLCRLNVQNCPKWDALRNNPDLIALANQSHVIETHNLPKIKEIQ